VLEHGVEGDLERGRVATDLSQQQSPFNGGEGPTGGIGFEVARALADEGADVIISGRNTERGEEAAQALGAKARFVLVDLTELDAVRALAEAAGDVDVLVNNAVAFIGGPAVEQDVESFEESFAANVRGPCFPTAVLVPKMFAK
jgi:NAD(P)-dependent dehydrogenase (short-subunit alcohol dehydrogenase family)